MDDQTLAAYLKLPPDQLGTGVFLYVNAPQSKKEFERDITYFHCADRGFSATAFKWVPNFVATFDAVSQDPCGQPCIDSCPGVGCLCNRSTKTCE